MSGSRFSGNLIPPGILCLELTLQDLESTLKIFGNGIDYGDRPSWKYPHVKLRDIDSKQLLLELREMNLTNEARYTQLLELCIDRLYFSLGITVERLKKICNKFFIGENKWIGNGREIVGHPHLLMHQLINQLKLHFPLLEGSILVFGDYSPKSIQEQGQGSETRNIEIPMNSVGNRDGVLKSDTVEMVNFACQTDGMSDGLCRSCNDIASFVKFVELTLDNCMASVTEDTTGAKIVKTAQKREPGQWEVITNACAELRFKCRSIIIGVSRNLEKDARLKNEITELKQELGARATNFDLHVNRIHKQRTECEKKLIRERQVKKSVLSYIASKEARVTELRSRLNVFKEKKVKFSEEENEMENAREKYKVIFDVCSDDMTKAKAELEINRQENADLYTAICKFQEEKLLDEAIMVHRSKTLDDELARVRTKNNQLLREVSTVKAQLYAAIRQANKRQQNEEARMKKLQNSPTMNCSDVELLRYYPDLNGPINPPAEPCEDMLETMEQQVLANTNRIEVLRVQNEKLRETVAILKNSGVKRNDSDS